MKLLDKEATSTYARETNKEKEIGFSSRGIAILCSKWRQFIRVQMENILLR